MTSDELDTEQVEEITRYVDIDAPPSDEPGAVFVFGTNQPAPAHLAAERYLQGLAPLIIVTGGVNRHNGIVEGHEFRRLLCELGVPDSVIRVEDTSANTWQNVELALPYLTEAVNTDLPVTAVCKWYHRRAAHILRTLVPELKPFHVLTIEPTYAGTPVTRTNWPQHPEGRRRVIREWQECPRRIEDGSFAPIERVSNAWQ